MAAKPFYSIDEVCARLGISADQVKGLVREGTLREFRDAGKVFFKADDIDRLAKQKNAPPAGALEDSGEILLEPVAEQDDAPDAMPSLADSAGGTSIIGLEPLSEEEPEQKEDTVITRSGIGVFDDDELEIDADPMAKTQITTSASDQVSLEGTGSGSGLLDLAREADDTALGADLLDEIYPGEEEAPAQPREAAPPPRAAAPPPPAAAPEPEESDAELEEAEVGQVVMPAYVPTGDPSEGLFAGLLVGGLILMIAASSVGAAAVQGFVPDYARLLGDGSKFYFFLGGALLTVLIALLVGWLLGRSVAPRRR